VCICRVSSRRGYTSPSTLIGVHTTNGGLWEKTSEGGLGTSGTTRPQGVLLRGLGFCPRAVAGLRIAGYVTPTEKTTLFPVGRVIGNLEGYFEDTNQVRSDARRDQTRSGVLTPTITWPDVGVGSRDPDRVGRDDGKRDETRGVDADDLVRRAGFSRLTKLPSDERRRSATARLKFGVRKTPGWQAGSEC